MYTLDEMKQIRKDFGLSYKDIKEGCEGVSLSSIQKAFGGYIDNPRKETLERLSIYFETIAARHFEKVNYRREEFNSKVNQFVEEASSFSVRGTSAVDNSWDGILGLSSKGGYTYDEYKKLDIPSGVMVEVIDGFLYTMDAPRIWHQSIISYILAAFFEFIKKNKGPCKVLTAPIDVRLEYDRGDKTVVQPDLTVICDKARIDNGESILGGPDFVLEVVSRSSRLKDTGIKLNKYRESGVKEYWIVDYESERVVKHNFEKKDVVSVYTFDDKVPVDIYDGKLMIDFKEVKEHI
jgi:Uma2 family endonuclease